jgi:hypothetical protein
MRVDPRLTLALVGVAGLAAACDAPASRRPGREDAAADVAAPPEAAASGAAGGPSTGLLHVRRLRNHAAYVPPQCFTKTVGSDGKPENPCYACHTRPEEPNYVDDGNLQLTLTLPLAARHDPWTNLLSPALLRAPPMDDAAVLAYVRHGNYFDDDGEITLARKLAAPPPAWDANGNHKWDGYVPDVQYRFDARGFDRKPDGTPTGWRAFAYYPFVGTFFPTNGSTDDVLIRLDPSLRQDPSGHDDEGVYVVNLAIVEALITRGDVAIDPVDEAALGVDLDLDGHLGRATRVVFDGGKGGRTRMRYVGRARDALAAGVFPIAPGLYPVGTEFFHTVRYLDVAPDGTVTMAPRMKEVRYARKALWRSYGDLRAHAKMEADATAGNPEHTHGVEWYREAGVSNGQGWYFQGFIEDGDGALRPQSLEESAFCEGCHGGIGATTDGTFAFPRKMASGPARGWYHWSQHDLHGVPEPRRRDGQYEYTLYLREAGAGDELRSNDEVLARFFDAHGALRPAEVTALHADVTRLLIPSAGRAVALDRAYHAVVIEQSYDHGRDAVLGASPNVRAEATYGEKTGIIRRIDAVRLAR